MAYTIARYGWRPDLPDHRDFLYSPPQVTGLPTSVDLRSQCPVVYDQGQLGSCTANAICGADEFLRLQKKLADFTPSRLFLYYNERVYIHETHTDSGAYIRDGMKSLAKQGDCPEDLWPYDESKVFQKPPKTCYTQAKLYKTLVYKKVVQTPVQIKAVLAAGLPVIFGFTVYESFESDVVTQTGVVPMPGPSEAVLGGHAVCAVGYDDTTSRFLCRNSWGESWGMAGYFTMPYSYLANRGLASDLWVISDITPA